MKRKVVVFDLEDTLYKEVDFLKSAYQEIAAFLQDRYEVEDADVRMFGYWKEGKNAFGEIICEYNLPITIEELLNVYRNHIPSIVMDKNTEEVLASLSKTCVLGLVTDGRSITQRNKINALGLDRYIDNRYMLISEEFGFGKPAEEPYRYFMDCCPNCDYWYVGDNPAKDFISPNRLGWTTVCLLDNGDNIHPQHLNKPMDFIARYTIKGIKELLNYVR